MAQKLLASAQPHAHNDENVGDIAVFHDFLKSWMVLQYIHFNLLVGNLNFGQIPFHSCL